MFDDFRNFKNKTESNSIFAVLSNPCYYSVLLYRISNKFYKLKLTPLAKIIWFINRVIFSVDIDYRAQIGKNFRLIHGIGVVIGCETKIGDNVSIYQGVTIGGSGKEKNINGNLVKQPIIEDDVIIYTNSCIFGPVVIKSKTKVKAGSILY
ncbi:serine O-acetyltransferase [Clostridium perfringens]|uniref:serine O-acetyltransferase n=1 Tax=Clostridium perfringens TaxID=1502 RepID=UPI000F5451B0|nr:hypothetical protein [Clostridium perfringens]EJT6501166.1 hypothetical protein [Clostridium perfringens]MDK3223016.1 hypothetical protein [Clostridium perfringens]MDM0833115.1 hypothetical protein [Clostridium perfringens]MDZ4991094.1 hypothetical protein [Clostridium perfringens]RQN16236.1 hypothetical protein EHZ12_13325 [Clostridium perfringens]